MPNPSGFFLAERPRGAPGSVIVAALEGTRPLLLELQALVTPAHFGTPRRTVLGADYNRVCLLLAVLEKRAGIPLQSQDVFVNVAGGARCQEPAADLGDRGGGGVELPGAAGGGDVVVLGEVGLTGEVRAIGGLETRLREAAALGFTAGGGAAVEPGRGSAVSAHRDRREHAGRSDRSPGGMTRGEGARRMTAAERGSGDGRRTSTSAAITIARVIFVSLVGYGGYLLVQSFDPPARWLLWAPLAVLGGVLAGVAVVALEQAARRLPMPRLFLAAIGALGGVLLAQLVASALHRLPAGGGRSGGRGFLSLLLAYLGVVFVLAGRKSSAASRAWCSRTRRAGEVRYKVLDT